jgi:hypothetical protein
MHGNSSQENKEDSREYKSSHDLSLGQPILNNGDINSTV